ncbi:MAG: diguanylate cyclase [Spirochaetota bacterium]
MEKYNLLIVDKGKDLAGMMSAVLKEEGYEIFTAASGEEAIDMCASQRMGIVVVEIELPDLSGYEVCKALKRTYFQEPLQVVLVTGTAGAVNLSEVVEVGGDDFIKKPFSPMEINARIKAAKIRLRNQISLVEEREFFRNAAKQEEELSKKIIDQNLYLKKAYQNLINLNKELKASNKELEKLAKYDFLSGLLNRLSLSAAMDSEIERSMRTRSPLSGIMMDIDHFKAINDNYGHQAGDDIIREIGKRLNKTLRKYDQAGRYGGEEFFIILPNTTESQAITIAERFRRKMEEKPLSTGDEIITVTASLGVAEFRNGEGRAHWLNRADKAMYMAKHQGRNKVVCEG